LEVSRVLSSVKVRGSEVEEDAVASTSKESEQPKENGLDHNEEEKQPRQLSLDELMEWLKDKPPLSPDELSKLHIERNDFMVALKKVQPSAKREGFATVPDVTWNDIGSLKDIREELKMTVLVTIVPLF
jgi:ribosome biogenesis ATPase